MIGHASNVSLNVETILSLIGCKLKQNLNVFYNPTPTLVTVIGPLMPMNPPPCQKGLQSTV